MAKNKTTRTRGTDQKPEAELEKLALDPLSAEAQQEDVFANVEISSVLALTGAVVKTLYEAEPNAYTDAKDTKLTGIEAGATADQTGVEIQTAYDTQVPFVTQIEAEAGTEIAQRRWSPLRVAQAISALGGGGGGITRTIDTPAAIGNASIKAVRLGGSATTFGGSAAAGYDVVIAASTEVTQLDFLGDSGTSNASGELVLAIDNSANAYDRFFMYELYDLSNSQKVDQHLTGNIMSQVVAGNVTTLTLPNVAGNYPNGFRLLLR